MTGLELLVVAAGLLWIASLMGLSTRLVRARRPEEHESAYQMMTAVIIAGVVMFVAPPVVQWLTGFQSHTVNGEQRYCSKDPNSLGPNETVDQVCLPASMSGIFNKIINGLRALGGVVLVVGLIWAAIKLVAVPRRGFSSESGRRPLKAVARP